MVVGPGEVDEGEDVGDFLVAECGDDGGHRYRSEVSAVYFDGALEAFEDDFDGDGWIFGEPVGAVEGWECRRDAFTGWLVAGDAGAVVNCLAAFEDFCVGFVGLFFCVGVEE